jgi:hypothetical protein
MNAPRRARGRWVLLFFPRAWRDRYGDELLDLLAEEGLTSRTVPDLMVAGLRQRAHALRKAITGGTNMTIGLAWRHPTAFAVAGALLLLPTAFFVIASLLAYEFRFETVRLVAAPVMDEIARWRLVDLLLVGAPPVAAVAALAPLFRLGVERRDGAVQAMITVRVLALNAGVALMACLLAGVLVWYALVESLTHVRA